MREDPALVIPAGVRDACRSALEAAFGTTRLDRVEPLGGGASGAAIHRVIAGGRSYVLRVEVHRSPLRNPHQYECMQIAAEAGIAPPLLYADERSGVAIMQLVAQQDLQKHPGGPQGLARDLGLLIARLQRTVKFPQLVDYPDVVARLFAMVGASTMFAPGLLTPHEQLLARIRAAYPWDGSALVSSHNDPNPRNILFDGERLWLIDWETAYRNDPAVDVAIILDQLVPTPDLQTVLVQAWLGRPIDRMLHHRINLARPLTRLYYACLLLMRLAGTEREPERDLSALTPPEFQLAIARGTLAANDQDTLLVLGKMFLAQFLAAAGTADFEAALDDVAGG